MGVKQAWMQTAACGPVPEARRGKERAHNPLHALAQVLQADPQGNINAFVEKMEKGTLRFVVERTNPPEALRPYEVRQEWIISEKPDAHGYYSGVKKLTAHDPKAKQTETHDGKSLHIQLPFLIEDIALSMRTFLPAHEHERLGAAIPGMISQSGMSGAYKQYFQHIADEFIPRVAGITELDIAVQSLKEVLKAHGVDALTMEMRHDMSGSYITLDHHYMNGNAYDKPVRMKWLMLDAQNKGKYGVQKKSYAPPHQGKGVIDLDFSRRNISLILGDVIEEMQKMAIKQDWDLIEKEIKAVAKRWGSRLKIRTTDLGAHAAPTADAGVA